MPQNLPTKSHDYSKALINARDEMFCQAYLTTFSATKSYMIAFDSTNERSASVSGSKILKREDIVGRLQFLSAQHVQKQETAAKNIINHLYDVAFLDPLQYCEIDTMGEPVIDLNRLMELTPQQRSLLKIEFGVGLTKDGDRIRTYKVSPHDKMDAIEKLLKLHQLYKPEELNKKPMAIQVNIHVPVAGQHWRNSPQQIIDSDPESE